MSLNWAKRLFHSYQEDIYDVVSQLDETKINTFKDRLGDDDLYNNFICFHNILTDRINYMAHFKGWHNFHHLKFRKFIIVTSFSSTFFIGASAIYTGTFKSHLSALALLSSGLVTLFSVWSELYKDKELSSLNADALHKIYHIREQLDDLVLDKQTIKLEDKLKKLKSQYRKIIDEFYIAMNATFSEAQKSKKRTNSK